MHKIGWYREGDSLQFGFDTGEYKSRVFVARFYKHFNYAFGVKSDEAAYDQIVKVLQRELPDGKPRKRKAKLSEAEQSLAEYAASRRKQA